MGKKVPLKPPPEANTQQVLAPQQQQQQQQQQPPLPPQHQQQQFYADPAQQQQHQPLEACQAASWPPPQGTPQPQLPQQNFIPSHLPMRSSHHQQPVQQYDLQHQGVSTNQNEFEYLWQDHQQNGMLTLGQQQQQQQQQQIQQCTLQQEQPLQQAQQQQLQQTLHQVAQEPPAYNQFLCQKSMQVPASQPEHHRGWGMGGGGSVPISPAKIGHGILDGVEMSFSNFGANSLEPPVLKRPRVEPPVARYPERGRLDGACQFIVEIPGTGPKLLVNQDEDGLGRRINTERGHMITLELSHAAEPSAAHFRFLLVYSKDAEASTPVYPCGNHRGEEHPRHMLEVKVGEREARMQWQDDPHPSVLVIPSALAAGRFTCQLAILCRNSCVVRKDLTLLCQLEVGDSVVGREPFKVKVSACPRRDAGAHARRATTSAAQRSSCSLPAPTPSPSGTHPQPQMPAPEPEGVLTPDDIVNETMKEAEKQARRTAQLVFLDGYFKEHFPDQYNEAQERFSQATSGKFV